MWKRLLASFRSSRLDRDLDEEVRFHLDSLQAEFEARGMPPDAARLAAKREFGAVEQVKERYRDGRGLRWIADLGQDLRYALRGIRQNGGFTAAAVLSLALGIGMNTAVFSVFHALLLRMLPVENPAALVTLYRTGGWGEGFLSYPLYASLRDDTTVLDGVLARSAVIQRRLTGGERAQTVNAEYVSGNYFSVLGVRPAIGRVLAPGDAPSKGAHPVAVLSYDAWKSRYAMDPRILGRTVVIEGHPFTIVGVAGAGFSGVEVERRAEVWLPLTMARTGMDEGTQWLWAMARTKPGVPKARIQAEIDTVMSRYLATYYGSKRDSGFVRRAREQRLEVRPGGIGISMLRKSFDQPVRILMGAVALVLLVACANVAGLLLARGASRRREMAMRLCLGASRGRLIRQWLTESAVLAIMGGALGFAIAVEGAPRLAALLPGGEDGFSLSTQTGGAVLLWTAAVAFCAALGFGLVAGIGATAVGAANGLKEGGGGALGSRLRIGLRRALVIAQVALSFILVTAAVLFSRNLGNLRSFDLGFQRDGVLTFYLDVPHSYSDAERSALQRRVLLRASALPGVTAASGGFPGPYLGGMYSGDLFVPGYARTRDRSAVRRQFIYPRYFEALGSAPLRGREFQDADRKGAPRVAVVNEAFAREFFGGADPVGRTVGLNQDGPADVTVVGLVRDMRHDGIRERTVPVIYVPEAQEESASDPLLIVRGALPPADMAELLRKEALAGDAAVTIARAATLRDRVDQSIVRERILASLSVLFGSLAATLAAIGIYGVMSYVVARRTSEVGLRIALGARPRDVVAGVVREGLGMTLAGIALGLPAAYAAARLARGLLFGIEPADPSIGIAGAAVLVLTGVAAAAIPARRAARVEPITALRTE